MHNVLTHSYPIPTDPADVTEKRLITEVYDFAKSIAELQLTESELALYSALVLLQPGKLSVYDPIDNKYERMYPIEQSID
jgi:hypothetical protein